MLALNMESRLQKDDKKMDLLVLNYVMDKNHPILSHQVSVIEGLAQQFKSVTVLTGNSSYPAREGNVQVFASDWVPGQNIQNVLSFSKLFFTLIFTKKYHVVFSHMTVIQSCLTAPFLRLSGINHFLWYAHAQNSLYLRWAHFWCTGVITSTLNSCPIRSAKVHYIGQSIDQRLFTGKRKLVPSFTRAIHVGRLDPSKGIREIVESVSEIRKANPKLTLTFVGSPSTAKSQDYVEKLKEDWKLQIEAGWLKFHDSIPRSELPKFLGDYDIFVHAFQGSLDKTLIEATFSNLLVATTNREYQRDFGVWSMKSDSLQSEIEGLLGFTSEKRILEMKRRLEIAYEKHSFSTWILRLSAILSG
jgi:glycosyltransferase involved in cell wall biosynthesis